MDISLGRGHCNTFQPIVASGVSLPLKIHRANEIYTSAGYMSPTIRTTLPSLRANMVRIAIRTFGLESL
jgi:hypothetical protein